MEDKELERLVEQYGPSVYRLAYARTGSRADAEDVTQTVFLKLLRARPEFREEGHARAWLLRTAANCAIDLHRSAWRQRNQPLTDNLPAPEEPEGEVLEAVLALPERYRTAIHLYYYEEMTAAEIARVLGVREGTVNTRLCRARAMLRELLGGEGAEHV